MRACRVCGAERDDVDSYTLLCDFCSSIATRLLEAGIGPDDEGMVLVREWNAGRHPAT